MGHYPPKRLECRVRRTNTANLTRPKTQGYHKTRNVGSANFNTNREIAQQQDDYLEGINMAMTPQQITKLVNDIGKKGLN
jgi:hypothetical protein